jgi:aspartyl-tRNA(Asn)/glutamyl-tRNA(Gln) amidotransferase subunit A
LSTPTDLTKATAAQLGGLYAAGEVSPTEVLDAVLERTERINPQINALTLIDAEAARAAARASEARWRTGQPLSPLDGAPVSIKELLRVKGWPCAMGSKLTDKTPVDEDAPSVARLREAGAIIFAQTASPEYGHKGVTDSPLNGSTFNPWNLAYTPGGSSGGSGAAVAAGLGPIALGTDGGGSVRIPASCTGLVGLKGTFGRAPAWPAPLSGNLANTGPMARTALDCALVMNAISRPDVRDPASLPPDDIDYAARLRQDLRGLKVALIVRHGEHPVDDEVAAPVTAAARRFAEMGCIVEEAKVPYDDTVAGQVWWVHWVAGLQRLLQIHPAERHGEFDPNMLEMATAGSQLSVQTVMNCQAARREIAIAWNLFFSRYDLLLSPTLAVVPWREGANQPLGADGQPNPNWACTAVFNLTRHPAISVPCGLSASGLPIGLQITAGHYRDDLVLAAAAAFGEAAALNLPVQLT